MKKNTYDEKELFTDGITEIVELLKLLKAGKKVRWDMNYVYPPTPIITVEGQNKEKETIELECVPQRDFDSYLVERDISSLDSITVSGYSTNSEVKKIEYVYANPQMNRIIAHLEDGTEVDYCLNVIDVWHAYKGEYVVDTIDIKIQYWEMVDTEYEGTRPHMKLKDVEIMKIQPSTPIEKVADFIQSQKRYQNCHMIINFPDGKAIHIPAS